MENQTRSGDELRKELCVMVPEGAHQVLVVEVARAHGLQASVPGLSRKRVLIKGTDAEVIALVGEAGKLGRIYEGKCFMALIEVLESHGLRVSSQLANIREKAERWCQQK